MSRRCQGELSGYAGSGADSGRRRGLLGKQSTQACDCLRLLQLLTSQLTTSSFFSSSFSISFSGLVTISVFAS